MKPVPTLERRTACSLSECALTRVASRSITSGASTSMPWSGAPTPVSRQAADRAAARADAMAISAFGASAANVAIRRDTVGSEATRPNNPDSAHSSATSARQSPPIASAIETSATLLPGSWLASGLRQGASAPDNAAVNPTVSAVRTNSADAACDTTPIAKAINELKSLIVVAPEHVRAELRGRTLARQLAVIEAMTRLGAATAEHRVTVLTLQSIAARIRFLAHQVDELEPELGRLLSQHPSGPSLLAQPGVGPVVAAQLLLSWSHPGRLRSEAAFAALAGVAPLEIASGQRTRHRLNRGGDRALNRALHTVAITRLRSHPESRAYETARRAQGKTHRDVRRCLKRTIARQLYRVMESAARAAIEPTTT
jgi:hypothetical protein